MSDRHLHSISQAELRISALSLAFPFLWIGSWGGAITPYLPDIVPGTPFRVPCLEALDSGLPFLLSRGCLSSGLHNFLRGPLSLFLNRSSLFRLDVLLSILHTQSVFLKCFLLLSLPLVWNWSVAFRTQGACSMPFLFPGLWGVSGAPRDHCPINSLGYNTTIQSLPRPDFCLSVCPWPSLAFPHPCML